MAHLSCRRGPLGHALLPAEMFSFGPLNDGAVVNPGKSVLELFPHLPEFVGLGRKRAPAGLALEKDPFIGGERTERCRDVPDPDHVAPQDRFALSPRMLAGD